MPYPPAQARAIAASYSRRKKPIPAHVKTELGKALRGTHMPNYRRRQTIAKAMTRKKKRGPAEDSPFFAPWAQGDKKWGKKKSRPTMIPTRMPYDR